MLTLDKYQAELFDYILGNDNPEIANEIASLTGSQDEIQRRLHVYRNNYFHSMSESLSDSFPVLKRLLGDDLFKALARDYAKQSPPDSASLLQYGYGFLDFIASHPACEGLDFLEDVGHIEWLYIQCFHGPNADHINLYDLLEVDESHLPQVSFTAHPNLHLFHSEYPALDIWQANLEEEVPELNLNSLPATYLMMYRDSHDVIPMQLKPLAFHFVLALTRGLSIQDAWQQAQKDTEQEADDDEVSDLLAFIMQLPVFQTLQINSKESS